VSELTASLDHIISLDDSGLRWSRPEKIYKTENIPVALTAGTGPRAMPSLLFTRGAILYFKMDYLPIYFKLLILKAQTGEINARVLVSFGLYIGYVHR
jgi:hypothetical protein